MEVLNGYGSSGSDEDGEIVEATIRQPKMALPPVDLTPAVLAPTPKASNIVTFDEKSRELSCNPRYEELFQPEAGPSNPFKSAAQLARKNMLSGFVEKAHVDQFHFDRAIRSFDTLGYAEDPSADAGNTFLGDVNKAQEQGGVSLFESKKTGGQKRKRVANYDASDLEGYTGPWAIYKDEKTIAKPDAELQKEMDEIVRKRKLKSKAGRKAAQDQEQMVEEMTTLHVKDDDEFKNRSFMEVPKFTGANLRPDFVPSKCYPPTKQAHTYKSHTKAINTLRWFPKSGHMFLSASMDSKVKLWEVYGNRKLIRTYAGHKLPVKDVCFNNDGTEFVSASFDNYMKLWDTETGQVKQRFHTGHRPFCVKFNPDDDKQHNFLSGMQNKKVLQWDTRTGEIEQEYDRHLGPVNSITFFDQNRRFCTTSDDKSIRIWEWGIPVDTKLIQNSGLHSIPVMTKAPSDKWIVGQCMDNRVVLFQLTDDKLRFARKKAFKGHNVAGYACSPDFSPDMSFLASGDSQGKVFIWDWRTHKIVSRWAAHENVCISVLWHPHEQSRMLSAGWDGLIKMWF